MLQYSMDGVELLTAGCHGVQPGRRLPGCPKSGDESPHSKLRRFLPVPPGRGMLGHVELINDF